MSQSEFNLLLDAVWPSIKESARFQYIHLPTNHRLDNMAFHKIITKSLLQSFLRLLWAYTYGRIGI